MSFLFGGKKKKDKAKDKAGGKDGKKKKAGDGGIDDDDDGYGELYDDGALEQTADEGVDSDVEAEANERYTRRPKPADGAVERDVEAGFLARQPCRAALVALGELRVELGRAPRRVGRARVRGRAARRLLVE